MGELFTDLFVQELARFRERKLQKALQEPDYLKISHGADKKGAEIVSPEGHLKDNPRETEGGAEIYRNALANNTLSRRTPASMVGLSPKEVFAVPKAGHPSKFDRFLVKPYHEKLNPATGFWMQHLIQGWAEMTNQSLWHAAGLGHMHQSVHVREHNMGPGLEKEPGVVIHMTPDSRLTDKIRGEHVPPSIGGDLVKMGVMDFLTHNMDRHPQNIMIAPPLDEFGNPRASQLLAIDHGRSFQYMAARKHNSMYMDHGVFGQVRIPDDLLPDPHIDSFVNYLGSWGIMNLERFLPDPIVGPGAMEHIMPWWPQVREHVANEFDRHLQYIKDPQVRTHLAKNFEERLRFMDNMVANEHHFRSPDAMEDDFHVPIHPYEAKV